jgi:hypothetical protein
MTAREMKIGRPLSRIGPTALLLAFVAVSLGAFSAVGYCVGRNTPTDLRFLEPRRAPTADEAGIALPLEYSLQTDERNDVIFVGDSTCRGGIDPAEFERLSGLRAYNLGSQGRAGAVAFVLTANAYMSRHPALRAVVYCISPVVFDFTSKQDDKLRERLLANYGPEVPGVVPWTESIPYFVKRGSVTVLGTPSAWMARSEDVRDVPLVGLETDTYWTAGQRLRESRGFGRFPGAHHRKCSARKTSGSCRKERRCKCPTNGPKV